MVTSSCTLQEIKTPGLVYMLTDVYKKDSFCISMDGTAEGVTKLVLTTNSYRV